MTKENEGEGIVYEKGQLNKSRFARLCLCEQNMRVKNHQLYQTNRKGIRIAYPFSIGAGKRT